MGNLTTTKNFNDLETRVDRLMLSEASYDLRFEDIAAGRSVPTIDQFAPYGITSMAGRIGYPAQALSILKEKGSHDIANEIIARFTKQYLDNGKKDIFVREFNGQIYGFLSDKYSSFDDDKVLDIVKNSNIMENTEEIWYNVNPIHFHARFIDKERFTAGDDESPLSMATFVDNSMVGASAFKIRFGIYRHACTNGCIWGLKEFTILKERHLGDKDWQAIMAKAISESGEMKELIRKRILFMQGEKSAIYGLDEDKALAYLKTKLATGTKTATKILDFYHNAYGGKTKWDLCNAITEASQELSLENRLTFETKAFSVA